MAFSDNLRVLREKKNYSQSELASLVGVDQSAIALFERGKRLPNIITGVDIARSLDTTVEKLLDEKTGGEK